MINAASTSQCAEFAAMNTVSRTSCQPTDLMRRRIPLDLSATYLWRGIQVSINTNSHALLQAASEAGLVPANDKHARSRLSWELVIEEDSAAPRPARAARVWRNYQSIFIEITQRQWFAYDAESGDGAGVLAAQVPEQAGRAFLETILGILGPDLHRRSDGAGCNG